MQTISLPSSDVDPPGRISHVSHLEVPDAAARARVGRRQRYRQHHALRERSIRGGAKTCGCAILGAGVEVAYHQSGRTTIQGVQRCGSMAACPICAENGRRTRAEEIDAIVAALRVLECHVFLVTATVKHRKGDDLRWLCDAVQYGWSSAWSGSSCDPNGYIGQIRAWDFTYGTAGWHPHIHGLIVIDPTVPVEVAERWVRSRFGAYQRALHRRGRDAIASVGGVSAGWDVQRVTDNGEVVAWYVAGAGPKMWSAGAEVALSTSKRKSVTPWTLLRAAVDGEVPVRRSVLEGMTTDDLWALWREYETATKGLRQIIVGRQVASLASVAIVDDDEAVIGSDDTPKVYSEHFSASEWQREVEAGRVWAILERVELLGKAVVGSQLVTDSNAGGHGP